MVSGKPMWEDCGADTLFRIRFSDELLKFLAQLSDLGRDFLKKCLRREPTERWKASLRSVLDCFNFRDLKKLNGVGRGGAGIGIYYTRPALPRLI
ncbi:hypothetical protein PVL29_009629 [Vitis rotundifolia]|uniref:Uncharacterized protein n=1 Tax=Vitis rotundifolia TaxID=103349 RepID=A0AA39DS86_VITRO|nr:hypothetical protein PVL29_009629 [Vitis rotundifolia]